MATFLALIAVSLLAYVEGAELAVTCTSTSYSSCSFGPSLTLPLIGGGKVTATYSQESLDKSGWHKLSITAEPPAHDVALSTLLATYFSAGVAEGSLTCQEIHQYYSNFYTATFPNGGPNKQVTEFIHDNDMYVRKMVAENLAAETPSLHFIAVAQILAQLDGIVAGYQHSSCAYSPLTTAEFLLLNLDGDLFDLTVAFPDPPPTPAESQYTSALEILNKLLSPLVKNVVPPTIAPPAHVLRCSALFKATLDDVFFGHTTWDTYATAAPRVFKSITLPVLHATGAKLYSNSFSSSPGFVASIDDYYVISGPADLTVIETSLSVYDKTAYAALTPNCLFCYMRSMVANMLAGSSGAVNPAEEWTEVFAEHASGTYNNQWMVLDRSRVGQTEGLFWVLEEAPGVVVAMDQTATLISDGYWPSFNVAYYSAVRNVVGEIDSYTAAPRAELFRELQSSVSDMESMRTVMTWNDYLHDPASQKDPYKTIMSRADLRAFPMTPGASGGIDTKVGSVGSGSVTSARVGMTYHPEKGVPVFSWDAPENAGLARETPHEGHPGTFEFEFDEF